MNKCFSFFVCVAIFVGCATDEAPKTSHFEHDHDIAAHWPDDLADAVAKMRRAVNGENAFDKHDEHDEHEHEHDKSPEEQLFDLVNWIPEIAADTELSEQDWIPLDIAAQKLADALRVSGNRLTEANRKQVESFCVLVEEKISELPAKPSVGPELKR